MQLLLESPPIAVVNAKVRMNMCNHRSFTHIYSIEVTFLGTVHAVKAEIGQSAGTTL